MSYICRSDSHRDLKTEGLVRCKATSDTCFEATKVHMDTEVVMDVWAHFCSSETDDADFSG